MKKKTPKATAEPVAKQPNIERDGDAVMLAAHLRRQVNAILGAVALLGQAQDIDDDQLVASARAIVLSVAGSLKAASREALCIATGVDLHHVAVEERGGARC